MTDPLLRGSGTVPVNNSRMLLNVPSNTGYNNLVKSWTFSNQDFANISSDGYPVVSPTVNSWVANTDFSNNYFGDYVWKWTGIGAMQMSNAPPGIVRSSTINGVSGKTFIEATGAAGDIAPGNWTYSQSTSLGHNAPRTVFALGWAIQSISDSGVSNGAGGTFIKINCKTNYLSGFSIGANIKIQVSGANANTGANATWSGVKVDANSFYLNVNQTTLLPSAFTNAQVGVGGEALLSTQTNLTIRFYQGAPPITNWSGMAALVLCKLGNEAAEATGQIWDQGFVDSFKTILNLSASGNPGFLRWMDISGAQASYEGDFSERLPKTYVTFSPNRVCSGHYVGTFTNGGSDHYTCSDPSVSVWDVANGDYFDNAIVQGKPSATNTGMAPDLAVGGHPAAPIIQTFDYGPAFLNFSGPPTTPGTDVLQFTFSATWLNGGTPLVLNYSTVAGDTSVGALNGNLVTFLSGNATLSTAKVVFTNSGKIVVRPRTAQAGRLTVTYTSGPAICTIGTINVGGLGTGLRTFVYNYLLKGWIWMPSFGGVFQCSLDSVVELCNRVGAHCYYNWPLNTKASFLTSVGTFFGQNLNSNLKLVGEYSNEPWNSFGGQPYGQIQHFGTALALQSNPTSAVLAYVGLRTVQFSALVRASWVATGRASTDFIAASQAQDTSQGIGSTFDLWQQSGAALNPTTNTIYGTYGGVNGGVAADFSTSGQRPGDRSDAVGLAPYWATQFMNYSANGTSNTSFDASQGITGTVIENAPVLEAAKDYALGNTVAALTKFVNTFNGKIKRVSGSSGGLAFFGLASQFASQEAQVAQFDAARVTASLPKTMIIHYEGGNQWANGADFNNGTNAPSSKAADMVTADKTNLANKITSLGWDVSAYTISTTNDATEMATMILQLTFGLKYDTDNNGVAAATDLYRTVVPKFYYKALQANHPAREVHPANYGYQGGQWGFFWNTWDQIEPPYQSYLAARDFNA